MVVAAESEQMQRELQDLVDQAAAERVGDKQLEVLELQTLVAAVAAQVVKTSAVQVAYWEPSVPCARRRTGTPC